MSNRWWLLPFALTLASAAVPGCNGADSSSDKAEGGAASEGGESATGATSAGDAAGGADVNDNTAGADANSSAGESGTAGSSGSTGANGAALPLDTFLYVHHLDKDHDELVARSFSTGSERVVTDLTSDGSEGWEIWGHTISPDRKTIVLASLYGPTKADNVTNLATRRLWSLGTDGSGFERLTPVFENTGAGRTNFSISVQDPMFTADGNAIIYDYGEWWYEGTTLQGGSQPWAVSLAGGLPEYLPTNASCTVVDPSVNPATGDVLLVHSVCVKSQDEGIFLYPIDGSEPTQLVARGYGAGEVDPSLTRASWVADGSGFVFVGGIDIDRGGTTERSPSVLLFNMESGEVSSIVVPDADTYVRSVAVSADGLSLVYCLQQGDAVDLRAIDFTQEPAMDVPLTDDGMSCDPGF